MASVSKRYAGLSREQLPQKAYELGFSYERYSRSCSQCTAAALCDLLHIDDIVVKVANSSCGGHATQVQGTCGALIGGTIILDYFFGRSFKNMSTQETVDENVRLNRTGVAIAKQLYDRFVATYGSILCPQIHAQLYGRIYYLPDPDEREKFDAIGAHSDPKKSCCVVVGNAARWVTEILLDQGVIEL
jgi:C_GCAxxG_C_C family probable redox protein